MKYLKFKDLFKSVSLITLILILNGCDRSKNLTYGDFDKNGDYLIKEKEFKDVFTANYYNDWDNNDDKYLDDEDFFVTVHNIWDVDNDGALSEEEYIMGFDYHYGDYIVKEFSVIDSDGDAKLVYTEFYDAFSPTEFFNDWNVDRDEYLSEDELASSVFDKWDYDNNGSIDLDEFSDFDSYYLEI